MTSIAIRRIHTVWGPGLAAMTLVASAWFVAHIVHTLHHHAADAAIAAPAPPPPAPPPPPPAPHRDGAALVARNMFCARCDGAPPPPPGEPPRGARFTARLIATSVESPTRGAATLIEPTTGAAGRFSTGAIAPGGAVIVAVRRDAIDVRFPDNAIETVPLDGTVAAPPPVATTAPAAGESTGVRSLGDDHWEVDRRLIAELVGGGAAAKVPGVRLMPVASDGKLTGIKVAAARAGSLARQLGLEPGDVIEGVGGQPIDATKLMELYGQLDQLTHVDLAIRRQGAARTLSYDLK